MGLHQPSHFQHTHSLPCHTPTPSTHLPSQPSPILQHLFHSSEQQAQDGPLDVFMSVDGRSKGPRQHLKHILQVKRATSYLLSTHTLSNPTPVTLYPIPHSPVSPTSHSLICSPSHSPSYPISLLLNPFTLLPLSLPPSSTLPLTKSLLRPNLLIFFTS